MKRTTELNERDILAIIAQRFCTDNADVKLFIEHEDGKDAIKAIIIDEADIEIGW